MPRVNAEQNKTPLKGQFYDGRRLRSLPPQPSFVNKRRRIDPDSVPRPRRRRVVGRSAHANRALQLRVGGARGRRPRAGGIRRRGTRRRVRVVRSTHVGLVSAAAPVATRVVSGGGAAGSAPCARLRWARRHVGLGGGGDFRPARRQVGGGAGHADRAFRPCGGARPKRTRVGDRWLPRMAPPPVRMLER